jgi:hypothetical protein
MKISGRWGRSGGSVASSLVEGADTGLVSNLCAHLASKTLPHLAGGLVQRQGQVQHGAICPALLIMFA